MVHDMFNTSFHRLAQLQLGQRSLMPHQTGSIMAETSFLGFRTGLRSPFQLIIIGGHVGVQKPAFQRDRLWREFDSL